MTLIEKILATVIFGLLAFLLFCIGVVFFQWLDSRNMPLSSHEAVVIEREFIEEHYTPMTTMAGKVSVTTLVHHPDAWYSTVSLTFRNKPVSVECEINEVTYNNIAVNDKVLVNVVSGRWSDNVYCKTMELIK